MNTHPGHHQPTHPASSTPPLFADARCLPVERTSIEPTPPESPPVIPDARGQRLLFCHRCGSTCDGIAPRCPRCGFRFCPTCGD